MICTELVDKYKLVNNCCNGCHEEYELGYLDELENFDLSDGEKAICCCAILEQLKEKGLVI